MLTGLYVHVPYCHTKCGYCDFYSVALGERRTAPLVDALLMELEGRLPRVRRIDTIFVGGGTPTVLPHDDLQRLFGRLGEVARHFDVVEFTTEANPATVDSEKIAILRTSGVNRISFGGQSLDRGELRALDRLHDPDDIEPGIQQARAGGIQQVNLDLMFGIPGQTLQSWCRTLAAAVSFGTDHLSCYGLTYEPATALSARMDRGMVLPCDNDLEADMFLHTSAFLEDHGFEQYEISNFAKPGCACRHNMIYWSNWPYLGLGPSAASYLDGVRTRNVAHIDAYIAEIHREGQASRDAECLTGPALAGETAMLQLRMTRGIEVDRFREQVGLDPLALWRELLDELGAEGLVSCDTTSIRLTHQGRLVADRIIGEFLANDSERPAAFPGNAGAHSRGDPATVALRVLNTNR